MSIVPGNSHPATTQAKSKKYRKLVRKVKVQKQKIYGISNIKKSWLKVRQAQAGHKIPCGYLVLGGRLPLSKMKE